MQMYAVFVQYPMQVNSTQVSNHLSTEHTVNKNGCGFTIRWTERRQRNTRYIVTQAKRLEEGVGGAGSWRGRVVGGGRARGVGGVGAGSWRGVGGELEGRGRGVGGRGRGRWRGGRRGEGANISQCQPCVHTLHTHVTALSEYFLEEVGKSLEEGPVELTVDNFDHILQTTPLILVEFYAEWCVPCQQLEPHFHAAAQTYVSAPSHSTLTHTPHRLRHSTHPHTAHTLTQHTHSHSTHPHTAHTLTQHTPSHSTHPHTAHTLTQHTHSHTSQTASQRSPSAIR